MSNLSKLEFVALDITGKNYLSWVLDAEIHLDAKGLGNTIIKRNEASNEDKAMTMIFLRHHLHEGLKTEYLTVKDPLELWINLKDRYDHLKLTVLPKARYEWIHLRLQDFKTVSEYNSAIFKQYREKGFKKYSELITCLLVAEQNNTLLIKNHEARPTGSAPFPEANAVAAYDKFERKQNNYRGRGHGRERGRGRGRNNYRHYGENELENNKGSQINPSKASLRKKENNMEAHLTFQNNDDEAGPSNKYDPEAYLAYKDYDFGGLANITHLETGDFFEDID
ncbi:PREDICTED: uncharacterized protein LOC109221845 [Nicotiana attenuata]|uniref:uncharacterized protein LOC109221845 n=1 Tax=Nicotiana attenuata TaxID=49451 RepID=UPI000904D254|nr:PREDICTED: uncharacterized protein LOC109221845 [Nicotiana attenuata]